MRRWTLGWALAACAITAAGCGGDSKGPTGAAKGISGQYYYLAVAPAAGGTITSADTAIACKSDGTGCGDATYHQTKFAWATPVVLTATALTGFQFDSWSGDCSGTTNVCTLGTGAATEYSVVAVFKAVAAAPEAGRRAGPRLRLREGRRRRRRRRQREARFLDGHHQRQRRVCVRGRSRFPYSLTTAASTQYAAAAATTVTVPLADGVADPAGVCFLGGAKQGFWVPTAGQAIAGCLVRQNDIAVTRASGYVAPVAAPVIVTTPAMPAVVGFSKDVTVGCGAGGVVTQVSGPTVAALTGPDTNGGYSFTTPDLATAFAGLDLAKLAIMKEGRPGFLSINQVQAAALTYSFKCAQGAAFATVSVPLVAAVNANLATALRGEPFKMAAYGKSTATLPGMTGPLWAAGAETTNGVTGGTNFDGSPWRAHDAVQVPAGVILILDGPGDPSATPVIPYANWKFCKGAKDSFGSCTDPASTTDKNGVAQTPMVGVPGITGNGTANIWFPATWKAGTTLYLTSDALGATVNGFKGEPNIPVKPQIWGGWDHPQRGGGRELRRVPRRAW